eukprot:204508_1
MAEMKEHYIYDAINAPNPSDVESDNMMSIQSDNYKSSMKEFKPGITRIGNQIARYDSNFLNSPIKIFCCFPGSCISYFCCESQILFEELLYALIFCLCVFLVAFNLETHAWFDSNNTVASSGFKTIFAFLAGLYLSLHITRWWRLRTNGIGNIWGASTAIANLLGPLYKYYKKKYPSNIDELIDILKHIHRIKRLCQASLALVFVRHKQDGFTWDSLVELDILTETQHDNIKSVPASHPEYVWHLIQCELLSLKHNHNKIYEISLDNNISLQSQVLKGRSGAGLIGAQIGTQLPVTYAHFVTVIGKLLNISMCITMAFDSVFVYIEDIHKLNPTNDSILNMTFYDIITDHGFFVSVFVALCWTLVKTFGVCLLLLFCEKLSNPFDNDTISFSGTNFVYWIATDFDIMLGFDVRNELHEIQKEK